MLSDDSPTLGQKFLNDLKFDNAQRVNENIACENNGQYQSIETTENDSHEPINNEQQQADNLIHETNMQDVSAEKDASIDEIKAKVSIASISDYTRKLVYLSKLYFRNILKNFFHCFQAKILNLI